MTRTNDGIGMRVLRVSPFLLLLAAGSAMAANPVGIPVPWVSANPAVPHEIISGYAATLKGESKNAAGGTYWWTYGDGSGDSAHTGIGDQYNLSVKHTYTCTDGQPISATLHVFLNGFPQSDTTYPMVCKDAGGATPAAGVNHTITTAQEDVLINVAIDESLWYEHARMQRFDAGGGNYHGQNYGYVINTTPQNSCTVLDAWQLHGSKLNGDPTTDPYVEDVQRVHNWLLGNFWTAVNIVADNRTHSSTSDINGNSIGLRMGQGTYVDGICDIAFASSGCPNCVAAAGISSSTFGRAYKDIVQDIVEYWAWGQAPASAGSAEGGWQYDAPAGSDDGSTRQWPILTMIAAESGMSATVPAYVRPELLKVWTNYKNTNPNDQGSSAYSTNLVACGGFGYSASTNYVNPAKTGAGIIEAYFMHKNVTDLEQKLAQGFIYRAWWGTSRGNWQDMEGNSYAMYAVMKSMRLWQPNVLQICNYSCSNPYGSAIGGNNCFDWYYSYPPGAAGVNPTLSTSGAVGTGLIYTGTNFEGLAANLVKRQSQGGAPYNGGFWNDYSGESPASDPFSTGWDTLILLKGVTTIPPTALICDCQNQIYDVNIDVNLSGACSRDDDLNRTIITAEWDFNYNPTNGFNVQATESRPNGASDNSWITTTKVGGYASAGTYNVALRVTDDNPANLGGPQTSINVCNVVVHPPPLCPIPTTCGAGAASCQGSTATYNGFVGVPITLDASGSDDPDGDNVTWNWSLSGNVNQFGDSTLAKPTWTYNTPGTYSVAVQVCDLPANNANCGGKGCCAANAPAFCNGCCTQCCKTAFATVIVGCHNPVANPAGPYTCTVNQPITLDGSGSTASDPGNQLQYSWDLNNDGVFGDSTAIKPTITCPATAGTILSTCIRVTEDVCGTKNTKCTTVTAVAVSPPVCNAGTVAPMNCSGTSEQLQLNGSASSDPQGFALTYTWTAGSCASGTVTFDNKNSKTPIATFNTGLLSGCNDSCPVTLQVNNGFFTTSCNTTLTITDGTAPGFTTTPQNTTVECDGGGNVAQRNAFLGSAAAADPCSSTTLTNNFGAITAACGATGSANVTFTAKDACGNPSSTSAQFTIVDTTKPSIACPAGTTVECTGNSSANANPGAATSSDTCGAVTIQNAAAGSYALGTTNTTFTSTDACGNLNSCTSFVKVQDTTKPSITCPGNVSKECTGNKSANVSPSAASASDSCTSVSVQSPAAGSYALGTTTVTYTATDTSGNAISCNATISVVDTTKPSITCPNTVTQECQNNSQANVNPGSATASDVCSSTSITGPAAGSYPLGATTVTYTAKDESNNSQSCSSTISVVDTTKPSITCPNTVTQECTGNEAANVNPSSATASDTCTAVTLSGPAAGSYPLGTTNVTYTAKDTSNNSQSCTAQIMIVDTTKPSILCPGAITAECTSNAQASVQPGAATANDVCAKPADLTVAGPAAGSYPLGTTTVTYTARDEANNTNSCSSTITIQDTTKPTIACPAVITAECTGNEAAPVTPGTAVAADLCTAPTVAGPAPGSYALGTTNITYTATDGSGNKQSCGTSIVVQDTTKPNITCPSTVTVECTGNKQAPVTPGVATATDVCAKQGDLNLTGPAQGSYPLGATNVTYTAKDEANNTSSCSSMIVVRDTTKPTLTCPAAIVTECTGKASAPVTPGTATGSDICSSLTFSGPAAGSYPLGTTNVTYTDTDESGNASTCGTSITVQDTTKPNISCPPAITMECTGSESAPVMPGVAIASDICTDPSVAGPSSGIYPLGDTMVTYTATDFSGNKSSCVTDLVVVDTTPPTVLCAAPVTVECTGNESAPVNVANATAGDICAKPADLVVTGPAGLASYPLGTTTLGFLATDQSGNHTGCSTSVTVVDTTPPAIVCPAPVVVECAAGGQFVDPGAAIASDICGPVQITNEPARVFPLGTTITHYSVTDEVGNTSSCTSSVTVRDTTPPVVTEKPLDIYEDDKAFEDQLDALKKTCGGDPTVYTFHLSDCVTGVTSACHGTLDIGATGVITKIEAWTKIKQKDSVSQDAAKKIDDAVKNAQNNIDHEGCPKFAFNGSEAKLPVEELDDGENPVFYTVYYTYTDNSGQQTAGTCNVNVYGTQKEQLDDQKKPAGDQLVPAACAICIGNGCGMCQHPGDILASADHGADHADPANIVCGNSLNDCAQKQAHCQQKHDKGACEDYTKKCLDTCP